MAGFFRIRWNLKFRDFETKERERELQYFRTEGEEALQICLKFKKYKIDFWRVYIDFFFFNLFSLLRPPPLPFLT